ncbi:hypothetical protein RJ639_018044 [Escallonia herrerae]|uniref:Chromo domain-containing protein n=1 Tax=Escallonia herrerae TaxID=1293975 RepID=A0AA88VBF8_9ASTE|nr:hypothetical protein RJ639_018044 [Escallonia herrerae]
MAYKVDPLHWWSHQLHPVFHVSMLKPFYEDTADPSRGQIKRQGLKPKAAEKRVAEAILNDRVITAFRKRHQEYLVKWQGHIDEENTWERAADLSAYADKIEAYHMQKLTRASTALVGENVTGCTLHPPSAPAPIQLSAPAPFQHGPMRPHKFFKSRAHVPVKHSARAPNCACFFIASASCLALLLSDESRLSVEIISSEALFTFDSPPRAASSSDLLFRSLTCRFPTMDSVSASFSFSSECSFFTFSRFSLRDSTKLRREFSSSATLCNDSFAPSSSIVTDRTESRSEAFALSISFCRAPTSDIASASWVSRFLDFITELPKSRRIHANLTLGSIEEDNYKGKLKLTNSSLGLRMQSKKWSQIISIKN